MQAQFNQQDVEILSDEPLYAGFFSLRKLSIRHRLFQGGWSSPVQRELCIRGDAVGILLFDPVLQCFALVEQIRIGVLNRPSSPWLLELVAGMLDKGNEDPEAVAIRESQEETGLQVDAICPMLNYFCSPGGSTEYFSLFLGKVNLQGVSGGIFGVEDEHENIRLHIVPVADAISALEQGQINNAMTIIALQWFQLHQHKLPSLWQI